MKVTNQLPIQLADRIWVYGVVVDRLVNDEWRKFVKFGVHRCVSREENMAYAALATEGKTRGLTTDNKIIVCEDMTDEARAISEDYITGVRAHFDDIMRPYMPGKHRIITNNQGSSSTELHEHDPADTDDYLRDVWASAIEEYRTGNNIPIGKIYTARPYLEEFDRKLTARPAQMLLGATTGAGKETSTLAILVREHDLGYGNRYDHNTLHVASATIPSTSLELIEELSTVAGMRLNGHLIDFSRIQVYAMRSFECGYFSGLKPRALRWASQNAIIVDSVADIPVHTDPGVVPVIIGSFPDIGLKANAQTGTRYEGLRDRVGIMAIGEAHQFLSKEENKLWSNIKNLHSPFLLAITGTPYDFIFNEDRDLYFGPEERVLFTRNELYSAKRAGDPSYQLYPDMQFYGITTLWDEVINKMKSDPRWADDINGFTWAKFHSYDPVTSKFKYHDLLIGFYRRLLGVTDNFTGQPDPLSIRSATALCDFAKRHLIIALPVGTNGVSVHEMLPALVTLLSANSCMGVYQSLVSYEDDLSDIKNTIGADAQPTATFTCIKHLTGANIPNWGSFVMLRPIGDSVKFFEQSTGRIIRPAPNKPNVGVFLGDIDAAMNIIVTVEEKTALDRGDSTGHIEIVHRTLDNYMFFSGINGSWSSISMPDLVKAIEEASARGSYGLTLCLKDLKTPKDFNETFKNITGIETSKIVIVDNGNKNAKNSQQIRTEQLKLDLESARDKDVWYKNMVKGHLARMRFMSYVYGYKTLRDCADAIVDAIHTNNDEILSMIGRGADLVPTYIYDTTQIDHVYANRWLSQMQEADISIDTVLALTEDKSLHDDTTAFVTSTNKFAIELVNNMLDISQ